MITSLRIQLFSLLLCFVEPAQCQSAAKPERDGPFLSIARLFRAPIKPESELISNLSSPTIGVIENALEGIEKKYPTSTNAHAAVKKLLSDTRPRVRRQAARTLGRLHASVDDVDVASLCQMLKSAELNEVLDGLKSISGVKGFQANPQVIALLSSAQKHVLMQACRTLAEIGFSDAIQPVELLTRHRDEDIREQAQQALTRIRVRTAGAGSIPNISRRSSSGTGFIVAEGGHVMTCAHVVEGAKSLRIRDENGRYHSASVVTIDPANDLCLLVSRSITNSPIPSAPMNSVALGQTVYCLGYPLEGTDSQNLSPVVGNGVVASLRGLEGDTRHLQVTVALNPGNSGGPVFDETGRWVGVAAHKLGDLYRLRKSGSVAQGFNFAVKSALAATMVDTIPNVTLPVANDAKKHTLEELVKRLSPSVLLILAE